MAIKVCWRSARMGLLVRKGLGLNCTTMWAPMLLILLWFATAAPGVLHAQSQLNWFPVAAKSLAMSCAFDGTNFLVGLENVGPTHTIEAQVVSMNGTKVGSGMATGRSGIATAVAFDGTNYLLIWEDNGQGTLTNESYQIYGQFINKAGAAVGGPFDISGLGVQFDGIKTVAYGAGKYLVTYTSLLVPGQGRESSNICIGGRMVNPDGTMGPKFRISSGNGTASDVAFDGTNFFVVWRESLLDREIRGRFVSPEGVPQLEVSVNGSAPPSDNPKSVAFNSTHYLVVWNDEVGGKGSMEWDCFGQLLSTSGALVGERITLTTEPGPQMVTSVASDGTNFLAVWTDMRNETNWDFYGQHISGNGSPIGGKVTLSTAAGNQLGGVGFANGRYLVLVNNGVWMGEAGISEVDSAAIGFVTPPGRPTVEVGGPRFGVAANRFGFNIKGMSGSVAVVEACTNLLNGNWLRVSTNVLGDDGSYFSDPQWVSDRARFYRVREP